MDMASIIGSALGLIAIVGGALLGGLGVGDLVAGTAALIVIGGTLAATLVSHSIEDLKRALSLLPLVFQQVEVDSDPVIAEILGIAVLARKDGVLAVEAQKESIQDPLLLHSVRYVVEGFDAATVREVMGREIELEREQEEAAASVWESAAGYAPSVGIVGAVLGLIQVMRSLDDPAKLGSGIAVAFLATVYGLVLSSLMLAPWGAKIRSKTAQRRVHKEVVRLGVAGIQEGINPNFLKEKMQAFVEHGADSE